MKQISFIIPDGQDLYRLIYKIQNTLVTRSYALEDRLFHNGGKLWWKLTYLLTGRCGTRSQGHWPVMGNYKTWLWKSTENGTDTAFSCTNCGGVHRSIRTREILDDRTDDMKDEAEKHGTDMVQPYRQNELSREFVELYPDRVKGMIKDGLVTKQQVKKSRNVWGKDIKGLNKVIDSGIVDHLSK